jgi:hypothetical protein
LAKTIFSALGHRPRSMRWHDYENRLYWQYKIKAFLGLPVGYKQYQKSAKCMTTSKMILHLCESFTFSRSTVSRCLLVGFVIK